MLPAAGVRQLCNPAAINLRFEMPMNQAIGSTPIRDFSQRS